jgi:hypothetical protein
MCGVHEAQLFAKAEEYLLPSRSPEMAANIQGFREVEGYFCFGSNSLATSFLLASPPAFLAFTLVVRLPSSLLNRSH